MDAMDAPQDRELIDKLSGALNERTEILEAYLFGSQARGEARVHSDVDVAVYVDAERAPDGAFGYAAELGTVLMRALGTNVDVVVLNHAPPLLYHRVLRDGVRILSRDLTATTAREGQAISRYCDFVPQLAKIERAASARIRAGEFGR
jgi:predicted nucleotidyltransferase